MDGQRLAVTIGVARFDHHPALDFAPVLATELADVLGGLDYTVDAHAAPELPGAGIGAAVTGTLAKGGPADVAIVHVVTHGEPLHDDATIFAVGTDGTRHADTDIAHWLVMQEAADRPLALFLLDLCSAGVSARLPWQARMDRPARGWVIAACRTGQAAYDGRFTQAVITVLRALRAGELDVDPSLRYVPLATVARAIRREVHRLVLAADADPQQVTATLVDISADEELPFFVNPAHSTSPRPHLRAAVEPAVLPFLDDLDEGLDATHFLERATGLGGMADGAHRLVGCFTGRDRELRDVSPWLNGVGPAPLCVVTGSPGSGKSALLGVLVCAANERLREPTAPIWKRVAQAPLPIPNGSLAAIHARQRGTAAIVASLALQLGLPEGVTTADLITALRRRAARPTLVLDALDEADNPGEIMTDLLLPLVAPADDTERPARLLVGVRHDDRFTRLFDQAWLIDLDTVDRTVLEDDLHRYVSSLLRTTPQYRSQGAVVGAFASSVASLLAEPGQTWGPFLVAGLYTRHFVNAHTDPVVTDPAAAQRLGEALPQGLPGVLELDLALRQEKPWLRPVMSAVAYARGAGMPVSVLTRVAPVFAPELPAPNAAEIRAALAAGKFYLRQAMDTDRSNVYRLFHQGLADTLAARPAPRAFLDALLSSLGPPEYRDWEAAEPYLFRHIADHAVEAGRLAELQADPALLLHPNPPVASPFPNAHTQAELALAAARAGRLDLASRAANMAGRPPLTWQPRWSIGKPGPAELVLRQPQAAPRQSGPVEAVAIAAHGGRAFVIDNRGLRTWRRTGSELAEWPFPGTAVAVTADTAEVMVGDRTGRVTLVDTKTTQRLASHAKHANPVCAVAHPFRRADRRASIDSAGRIVLWSPGQVRVTVIETNHASAQWTLCDGPNGLFAAAPDRGDALLFQMRPARRLQRYGTPFERIRALALSRDGRYIVTAGAQGVFCYDRDRADGWLIDVAISGVVGALTVSPDGGMIVAGDQRGCVRSWMTSTGRPVHDIRVTAAPITMIASSHDGQRFVVADGNRDFHIGDPSTGQFKLWAAGPDPDLVTAFTALDHATALIGWSGGFVADLHLGDAEGRLVHPHVADGPVAGIGRLVVGGERMTLVSGQRDRWLLGSHGRIRVDLDAPEERHGIVVVGNELVRVRVVDGEVRGNHVLLGQHPGGAVVACARVDGRPTAFTGGDDGVVRVWDLVDLREVASLVVGRPVWRLAVAGSRLLVGVGGELIAFEHVSAVR